MEPSVTPIRPTEGIAGQGWCSVNGKLIGEQLLFQLIAASILDGVSGRVGS